MIKSYLYLYSDQPIQGFCILLLPIDSIMHSDSVAYLTVSAVSALNIDEVHNQHRRGDIDMYGNYQ